MENFNQELANLTPEQRQLVELMLRKRDDHAPTSPHALSQQGDLDTPVQHRMTGLVPLTGPHRWFFESAGDYGGSWIWVLAYEVPSFLGRSPELIAKVFEYLWAYHDELRAYFVRQEAGWQQMIVEPGAPVPFTCVNLAELEPVEQDRVIKAAAAKLQLGLDLSIPPLMCVRLFYLGDCRPARLVILAHHLVMDGVSMGIMAGDLQTAYQQMARGEPIRLPPKTVSIQEYVECLQAYTRSEEMRRELEDYWFNLPWSRLAPLPVDDPTGTARRTIGGWASVKVALDAEETHVLQTVIPGVYKAQISETLLMAVMQAVTCWTGRSHQLVSWGNSGRGNGIFGQADLDASRTVGWLGFDGYLLLERVAACSPIESLQAIQEQARRIPNRGMGWYLLRYYGDTEMVEKVRPLINDATVVMVNYLGNMADPSTSQFELMRPVDEPRGIPYDPQARDHHPQLYITAKIVRGCFDAAWEYNSSEYNPATIERIASDFRDALQALVKSCQSQVCA